MKQSPFVPLYGAPQHTLPRVLFRFMAGRPLDGVRRSDATFMRRGRQYIGPGWHTRWQLAPGWLTLAVRLGTFYALVIVARGWWHDPSAAGATVQTAADAVRRLARVLYDLATAPWSTLSTLGALAQLAGAVATFLLARKLADWRRDREIIRPLALALAGPLGYAPEAPSRPWLRVPRVLVPAPPWRGRRALGQAWRWVRESAEARESAGWARVSGWLDHVHAPRVWVRVRAWVAGRTLPARLWLVTHASVRVLIPHELGAVGADVRGAVLSGVAAKLPGDWRAEWRLSGATPRLRLTVRQQPPKRIDYVTALPVINTISEAEILLGVGVGLKPVTWQPEQDSPHLLISCGSGAGKSVLIRLVASQALNRGWFVIVVDVKQDHHWAADLVDEGVPGITYLRKPAEIHNALIRLEEIRSARADADHAARGRAFFQRVLIIMEEMNLTIALLRQYWLSVKGKGDPARSPAVVSFGNLSAAGRSARMHLVAVGQYLTADVMGGPSARENFGCRVMARYTVAAWRTLVPEHAYAPKSMIRGRMQVCTAEGSVPAQVPFLDHVESAELARSGVAGILPAGTLPFSWTLPGELPDVPAHPALSLVPPPRAEVGPERLTLAGWVRRGTLPGDYEKWKKRRQRAVAGGRWSDTDDQRYTLDQIQQLAELATDGRHES